MVLMVLSVALLCFRISSCEHDGDAVPKQEERAADFEISLKGYIKEIPSNGSRPANDKTTTPSAAPLCVWGSGLNCPCEFSSECDGDMQCSDGFCTPPSASTQPEEGLATEEPPSSPSAPMCDYFGCPCNTHSDCSWEIHCTRCYNGSCAQWPCDTDPTTTLDISAEPSTGEPEIVDPTSITVPPTCDHEGCRCDTDADCSWDLGCLKCYDGFCSGCMNLGTSAKPFSAEPEIVNPTLITEEPSTDLETSAEPFSEEPVEIVDPIPITEEPPTCDHVGCQCVTHADCSWDHGCLQCYNGFCSDCNTNLGTSAEPFSEDPAPITEEPLTDLETSAEPFSEEPVEMVDPIPITEEPPTCDHVGCQCITHADCSWDHDCLQCYNGFCSNCVTNLGTSAEPFSEAPEIPAPSPPLPSIETSSIVPTTICDHWGCPCDNDLGCVWERTQCYLGYCVPSNSITEITTETPSQRPCDYWGCPCQSDTDCSPKFTACLEGRCGIPPEDICSDVGCICMSDADCLSDASTATEFPRLTCEPDSSRLPGRCQQTEPVDYGTYEPTVVPLPEEKCDHVGCDCEADDDCEGERITCKEQKCACTGLYCGCHSSEDCGSHFQCGYGVCLDDEMITEIGGVFKRIAAALRRR